VCTRSAEISDGPHVLLSAFEATSEETLSLITAPSWFSPLDPCPWREPQKIYRATYELDLHSSLHIHSVLSVF
jgi:hypothetical protein